MGEKKIVGNKFDERLKKKGDKKFKKGEKRGKKRRTKY